MAKNLSVSQKALYLPSMIPLLLLEFGKFQSSTWI